MAFLGGELAAGHLFGSLRKSILSQISTGKSLSGHQIVKEGVAHLILTQFAPCLNVRLKRPAICNSGGPVPGKSAATP